jgi:hypothetical protein
MFVCRSKVPIERFRGVQRGCACHRTAGKSGAAVAGMGTSGRSGGSPYIYREVTSHLVPGVLQLHQGASHDREKDERIVHLQRELAQFQSQQLYAPPAMPTNAQLQNQGFLNSNNSPVRTPANQGHNPMAMQKQMEALMN